MFKELSPNTSLYFVFRFSAQFAKFKEYKQRCNRFFMDVVSRLCFRGNQTPDDDVIRKLLTYVTREPGMETSESGKLWSKNVNPFNVTIDPTPVVRSILLQLLLRSR